MENKVTKYQSNLEVKQPEIIDIDRSEWSSHKCWRVDISYSHHVWITPEEKEYFLLELAKGKKIIRVGNMILTNRFLAITKVN